MLGQILAALAIQGRLHAAPNAGNVVGPNIDSLLAKILAATPSLEQDQRRARYSGRQGNPLRRGNATSYDQAAAGRISASHPRIVPGKPWKKLNLGISHSTALVEIPCTLGGDIAEDYHRNIHVLQCPKKTKLLIVGLYRSDIEYKVAYAGMPTEEFRIRLSQPRIYTVRDHAEAIQRNLKAPGDLPSLNVRIG